MNCHKCGYEVLVGLKHGCPHKCAVCGRDHFLVHSAETICDVCESWAIYAEAQLKGGLFSHIFEGFVRNLVTYSLEHKTHVQILPNRL